MRVSTSMIFDAGVSSMNRQSAELMHIQQQIASGKRILRPSDDPVAAARVLEVTQSKDILAQFSTNQANADAALRIEDTQLDSLGELMVQLKELAIQAGGPNMTATNLKTVAVQLRARYEEMMGIANAVDGQGQYLFSGYQGATKPFSGSVDSLIGGGEITYAGDDGQRRLQISATRHIEVGNTGNEVFVNTGNGESVFKTLATLIGDLEANDTTGLTASIAKIGQVHDNILRVRASVGSRMNEIDALGYLNQDMSVQYERTLSDLQDLDYAKAISDMTLKQNLLQAAQASFSRISQLSLFNYLS